MTILLAAFWWVYGGDVERLGDREYSARAAAHGRLKAAGIWAVPALKVGLRGGNPERRMRIELILNGRASLWQWVVKSLLSDAGLTDAQLLAVARVVVADAAFGAPVYAAVDASGAFQCDSARRWVHIRPYITGALDKEVAHMLKLTRMKLLPPQPVPPPRWWDGQ